MIRKEKKDNLSVIRRELPLVMFLFLAAIFALVYYWNCGGNYIYGDGAVYLEYFTRIFITRNFIGSGAINYPMGTALFQMPFLLLSCLIKLLRGVHPEVWTLKSFDSTVAIAAFFYWAAGVSIIYFLLRRRYSQAVSILSCISMSAGTMLIAYFLNLSSYSHIYGFFVCTLFFSYVRCYEEKRNDKNENLMDFLLGFILGLAVVVRNTHIIMGAVYLFYNVTDLKSLLDRLKKLMDARLITQVVGGAIPVILQVVAWRLLSGKWILYSYGDEQFAYLFKPQIIRVLFSDAKGLFIFCPILLIATIAMVAFRKENTEYRIAQWVIFAGVTYIVASWWCWWLGWCYGQRMHCDILCIFAIPLASLYKNLGILWKKGKGVMRYVISITVGLTCVLFVLLNIFWFYGMQKLKVSSNLATWYELKTWLMEFINTGYERIGIRP